MAELKTKLTAVSPRVFLDKVDPESKRRDCYAVMEMMREITGEEPKMWGPSIVGFGSYHYKSERSRQEGDWPITGFAPRRQAITLYLMLGFEGNQHLLDKLGKYKKSVGCLYIKRLVDVDGQVLHRLIEASVARLRAKYPVDRNK